MVSIMSVKSARTKTMIMYLVENVKDPVLTVTDRKFIVSMYSILEYKPQLEATTKQLKYLTDLTLNVSGQRM